MLERIWRPSVITIAVGVFALAGLSVGLYPMTAAWITSVNQSKVILGYEQAIDRVKPSAPEQLAAAHAYNDALRAGIKLGANADTPADEGISRDESVPYKDILRASDDGLMARVKIPAIAVDLPIYHGTSDEVLLRGAGHLEGSHLPVGGLGTHSVITAHRGLVSATMFSDLDKVKVGDRFSIEVFGEALTYEIRSTAVIEPTATGILRADPERDLISLITCTPLGINSHRIVVTAERAPPLPRRDAGGAGAAPTILGFPWWVVLDASGVVVVGGYLARQGMVDGRIRLQRRHPDRCGLSPS